MFEFTFHMLTKYNLLTNSLLYVHVCARIFVLLLLHFKSLKFLQLHASQ